MPVRSAQLILLDTRATPETRGDCEHTERPCRYTACRHHLWSVDERPGRRWDPGQRQWTRVVAHHEDTCVLDCAAASETPGEDEKHMSFVQIGKRLGVNRERARQIHDRAIEKLKEIRMAVVLEDNVMACAQCSCKTSSGCEFPGQPIRAVPDVGAPDWCPMWDHPLLIVVKRRGGKTPEAAEGVRAWQEALEEEETW